MTFLTGIWNVFISEKITRGYLIAIQYNVWMKSVSNILKLNNVNVICSIIVGRYIATPIYFDKICLVDFNTTNNQVMDVV